MRCGPLDIDVNRLRVNVGGKPVNMSGLQLKLLLHLIRHPDWVFTREQLLAEIWGVELGDRGAKAVDVLVCRLRKRLGPAGRQI